MDDPDLDPRLHREALRGLARLNAVSLAGPLLWRAVAPELKAARRPLTLLDIACGGGEVLSHLHRKASGRLRCTGLDISPTALRQARKRLPRSVRLIQSDILDPVTASRLETFDIVICSLFLHHLREDEIVGVLEVLRRKTRRALLVTDLERSLNTWWGVWFACHVVTASPVVRFDGPRSVEAAFTRRELLHLAHRAGLRRARVRRRIPARWLLIWRPRNVTGA